MWQRQPRDAQQSHEPAGLRFAAATGYGQRWTFLGSGEESRVILTGFLVTVLLSALSPPGDAGDGAGRTAFTTHGVVVTLDLTNSAGDSVRVFRFDEQKIASCTVTNRSGHPIPYTAFGPPLVLGVYRPGELFGIAYSTPAFVATDGVPPRIFDSGRTFRLGWMLAAGRPGADGLLDPIPPGRYELRVASEAGVFRSDSLEAPGPIRFEVVP